jgi:hypothetical protein
MIQLWEVLYIILTEFGIPNKISQVSLKCAEMK